MTKLEELSVIFWSLLFPLQMLYTALSYLPSTILRLFASDKPQRLPLNQLQNAWFGAFWAYAGPRIRQRNGPRIAALLEGRVTKARVVDTPVMPPVDGIVLDVGPGLGFWVDLYAKARIPVGRDGAKSRNGGVGIQKIYGVEPNVDVHAELGKHIREAGLEGVYEILPVGIQALSLAGTDGTHRSSKMVEKGSVDCIVSLLCMCSIPEPEKNIAELYEYLKEGGRWYVFEHVKSKGSWPMRLYQALLNLVWPTAIGGCQLCRDTERSLRQAGPWKSVDLAQPPEEPWHATIPHVFGTLTK